MNGAAVFLIAFFTSVATSVGTFFLVERLDLFDSSPKEEMVLVPKLEGLSKEDAVSNLNHTGLVLMIGGRQESPTAAEGTVLQQSVPMGQSVSKGQVIGVTLAIAAPEVPSLVGKTIVEATGALKEAGYQIKTDEPIHHDSVPEGQIISQTPEAGASLEREESVSVQVSKGAGQIEVPKLMGFRYTTATKKLEALGLKAKIRWVNLAETSSSIVLSQTPKPGQKAAKDAEVEIVINRE